MPQNSSPAFRMDARWERSIIAPDGSKTALMLRITAADRQPETEWQRAPLDVAFVLDRSGSMAGEKLRLAKEAVDVATAQLRDDDRVALVTFDDRIERVQRLQPATARTKTALRLSLTGVDAGGTTDLCRGWLTGCQELANNEEPMSTRPCRALLLTDGHANAGTTDPLALQDHAAELRKRGISTTTVGVGDHYNQDLLTGMAEAGGGNYEHIAHPSELRAFFSREIGEMLSMVAINPRLHLTLPRRVHAWHLNAFPTRRVGKTISVNLSDLAAGDEVTLCFDCWAVSGERDPSAIDHATARLSWTDPAAERREELDLRLPALTLGTREEADRAPVDDEVREQAALERAAHARREGIRLDRAGRFAESRSRFRHAATLLSAAPQSTEVQQAFQMSAQLADADAATALAESVRKQRFADDHRRSRGRRP